MSPAPEPVLAPVRALAPALPTAERVSHGAPGFLVEGGR